MYFFGRKKVCNLDDPEMETFILLVFNCLVNTTVQDCLRIKMH